MTVKLTQPLPAFRIDDAVLDRLERLLKAKCAEAGPPQGSLSVSERVRVAGRRTPEEHEHKYGSVDELRRPSGGPVLLRDYRLHVSTPWDSDGRYVSFSASGGGTASVGMEAPDAAWCREVTDAVLGVLRPHAVWYGMLHRASYGTIAAVTAASVAAMLALWALGWHPLWNLAVLAIQFALMGLMWGRERFFPAADIRVRRRGAQSAPPEGGQGSGDHPRGSGPGATGELGGHRRRPPEGVRGGPDRQDRGDRCLVRGERVPGARRPSS